MSCRYRGLGLRRENSQDIAAVFRRSRALRTVTGEICFDEGKETIGECPRSRISPQMMSQSGAKFGRAVTAPRLVVYKFPNK